MRMEKVDIPAGSTKERILNAAEMLFSEHGYENVSMKNITDTAGSNIASVNYHFRTKLGLLRDVLARRARELNKERHIRLREISQSSGRTNQDIEKILAAFLEPALKAGGESEHGKHFQRIISQISASPNPEVRKIISDIFDKVAREFLGQLKKACNELSREEFYWRVSFVYGAMMYAHLNNGRIQSLAGAGFDAGDMTKAIHYMVPFLSEGMKMKPTGKPGKSKIK